VGKTLKIGNDVQLKITDLCPRCVMTTVSQGDLPKDTDILRTAAQHNGAHVGVYAEVLRAGTVTCDDTVSILS
jgi:MOSC domain.